MEENCRLWAKTEFPTNNILLFGCLITVKEIESLCYRMSYGIAELSGVDKYITTHIHSFGSPQVFPDVYRYSIGNYICFQSRST